MNLVRQRSEIVLNLLRLGEYLNSSNQKKKRWAVARIRRGNNFVTYNCSGKWLIGPSRFCGYVGNTRRKHTQERPAGSETDPAIRKILGREEPSRELEAVYRAFCEQYGVEPYDRKDEGERRFWIIRLTERTKKLVLTSERSAL